MDKINQNRLRKEGEELSAHLAHFHFLFYCQLEI